jgi:hypothetical protein
MKMNIGEKKPQVFWYYVDNLDISNKKRKKEVKMNVEELIELLQDYNQDAEVRFFLDADRYDMNLYHDGTIRTEHEFIVDNVDIDYRSEEHGYEIIYLHTDKMHISEANQRKQYAKKLDALEKNNLNYDLHIKLRDDI